MMVADVDTCLAKNVHTFTFLKYQNWVLAKKEKGIGIEFLNWVLCAFCWQNSKSFVFEDAKHEPNGKPLDFQLHLIESSSLLVNFFPFFLFRSMVKEGIPHSLRPYVWLRLAGAMQKKNLSEVTYKQVNFAPI